MDQVRRKTNATSAYQRHLTGKGVTVAFLDTGISMHPDLQGRILAFRDFQNGKKYPYDDSGHGTHVAGICCGSGQLSRGQYAGMAPGAGIVSANAQTGNIVLLGQNIASGNLMHALRYLLPLAAFFLGVYLTEWIKHFYKTSVKIHWRQIVLIIEILILGITGFLPNEPTLNVIANIMLSFACAMQVDTFRKFRSIPCATTMCIGNMRSATEYLCLYHISKDPAMKYKSIHCGFIILVFAIGAAFGASCSAWFGVKAIWIAMAMQVVGFFMMFAHQDIEAFEKFEEEEKEKIRQTHARKK